MKSAHLFSLTCGCRLSFQVLEVGLGLSGLETHVTEQGPSWPAPGWVVGWCPGLMVLPWASHWAFVLSSWPGYNGHWPCSGSQVFSQIERCSQAAAAAIAPHLLLQNSGVGSTSTSLWDGRASGDFEWAGLEGRAPKQTEPGVPV